MEAASKYQLTANKSFPNCKQDDFRTIKKSGNTFAEPEEIHIEPYTQDRKCGPDNRRSRADREEKSIFERTIGRLESFFRRRWASESMCCPFFFLLASSR